MELILEDLSHARLVAFAYHASAITKLFLLASYQRRR